MADKTSNYFYQGEQNSLQQFDTDCQEQSQLFFELVEHSVSFLAQLNGKIKTTDHPDGTIELFLGYNITLLSSAFNTLRHGYFGAGYATLRQVAEALSLALYFFEFPSDEAEYLKNRKSFYTKLADKGYGNWIQGVLRKIDKEGNILNQHGIESLLEKLVFTGVSKEASEFLHANPEPIKTILTGKGSTESMSNYIVGPHYLGSSEAKVLLIKILHLLILNLMATDKIFAKHIQDKNFELIDRATASVNQWNSELKKATN